MQKFFVKIENNKIAFVDEGEGFPVLFLHGFPTSSFLWKDVISQIKNRWRCVAPDLLGLGDTKASSTDFSFEAQFEMLKKFLETLGLEKVHVVAHDQGGAIAHMLAIENPQCVEKMVLIDIVCYNNWPVSGVKLMKALAGAPLIGKHLLGSKLLRKSASLLGGGLKKGFYDRGKISGEIIAEHERTVFSSKERVENLIRYLKALDNKVTMRIAHQLKAISAPILVLWAENDGYLDKQWAIKLKNDIPTALGPVMIKECGHFVPWEKPEELNAVLSEFLGA